MTRKFKSIFSSIKLLYSLYAKTKFINILLLITLFSMSITFAYVGHGASQITGGTFAPGNFSVNGSLLPSKNNTFSLGSPTKQWKDLYVSTGTIYIGGKPLTVNSSTGTLKFNNQPVVTSSPSATPNTTVVVTKVTTINSTIFAVGNNALFVNKTTGFVGIGNVNPQGKLDIQGGNDVGAVQSSEIVRLTSNVNTAYRMIQGVNSAGSYGFIRSLQNGVGELNLALQPFGGNVGIGTTSPGATLDVNINNAVDISTVRVKNLAGSENIGLNAGYSAVIPGFTAGGTSVQALIAWKAGTPLGVGTYGNSPIVFATNDAERMRIQNSTGNVGIGTTSPNYKLEVDDSSLTGTPGIRVGADGSRSVAFIGDSLGGSGLSSGTLTLYNQSGTATVNFGAASGVNSYILNNNFGLGTSSPAKALTIVRNSGVAYNGNNLYLNSNGPILNFFNTNSTDGNILGGMEFDGAPGNWYAGGIYMKSVSNSGLKADIRFATRNGSDYDDRMVIQYNGNVGIGTTNPVSKLEVSNGAIVAGDTTATQGSLILAGYYNGLNSYLATFGSHYSSGALVLGYATKPKSGAVGYVSSTGANIERAAINLGNDGFHLLTGNAQTVSYGSDVTMAEKLTVLTNGNVGIGLTNPSGKLHINSSSVSGTDIYLQNKDTGGRVYRLISTGSSNDPGAGTFSIADATANAIRLVIKSDGNVGIGETSPGAALHIKKSVTSDGLYDTLIVGTTTTSTYAAPRLILRGYQAGNNDVSIYHSMQGINLGGMGFVVNDAGARTAAIFDYLANIYFPYSYGGDVSTGTPLALYIKNDGKIGTYTSSIRYKKNVTDMVNSNRIYNLRPVDFNWKSDGSKDFGLIAEEVQKTYPELVYYINNTIQGVRYEKIIVPVLKQVQEQQTEIEQLKAIVCQDHPTADICK